MAATQQPLTTGSGAPARRSVESRNPATGEVWALHLATPPAEVAQAVAAARAAQPAWAARPLRDRVRVLERIRLALYRRRAEIAQLIERENGKPAAEALAAEVVVLLDLARYYRREAPRVLGEKRWVGAGMAHWRKQVRLAHEPYGVVGIIAPWNYPLMLPMSTTFAALLGGNGVVVKPSEYTPVTGLLIEELSREAGVPEGLVSVVPGAAETGQALIAANVDKLFFTGSATTGRIVAAECATRMIPVVLELGGSDPAIVLEDADLRTAVSGILWGRFSNAGQTCVAPKRVLAVSAVHDRFVAKLAEAVTALGVGPERDLGALIRPWQTAHLEEQLADALARGARIAARAAAPTDVPGYFAPTLLTDVTPEMRVMREESFGPLLPVLRVRDAEEALAIANDTPFGLSASIWSRDTARAVRLAARVEAGTVHINDAVMGVGMADVPHGGVKESGTGRMHGAEGLLECVRSKAVIVDRLPGTPQPWWFESGGPLDAFVRFSHGASWRERLAALPGTLALLMRMRRTR